MKRQIEMQCGLRCAVIYGGLPPEARSEQARLFNDPKSGYDVLVASDAVGMGLNLHIRRMVFSTTVKFDGKDKSPMSMSQIKQIAGRAGRYGKGHDIAMLEDGNVTSFHAQDLRYIRKCVHERQQQQPDLEKAGLQPTLSLLEEFADHLPDYSFSELLTKFEEGARMQSHYFLTDLTIGKFLSDAIHRLPMTIQDRFGFICAPVRHTSEYELMAFVEMARVRSVDYVFQEDPEQEYYHLRGNRKFQKIAEIQSTRGFSPLDINVVDSSLFVQPKERHRLAEMREKIMFDLSMGAHVDLAPLLKVAWSSPKTSYELDRYESLHRVITMYQWLHYRFPKSFPNFSVASQMKGYVEDLIDEGLRKITHVSKKGERVNLMDQETRAKLLDKIMQEMEEPAIEGNETNEKQLDLLMATTEEDTKRSDQ
jgi:hypothetical protein